MPNLTPAQLTTVKADIIANPDLSVHPNNSDGNSAIAALYNAAAVPDYWVYRTDMLKTEVTQAVGPTGTFFTWTGTGYITRDVQELMAFDAMFGVTGTCDPSRPNVRAGLGDMFSGAGEAQSNRQHIVNIARVKATRAEKLLAAPSTFGLDGKTAPVGAPGITSNPATRTFVGFLVYEDIAAARVTCRNLGVA